MAVTVTTLMEAANCFNCVTPGMWSLIRLALLARIADGNTMSADVATLLAEGGCMACQAPGQQQLLELALLQLIQENGGGGSGSLGCFTFVSTVPVAPPDPTKCTAALAIGYGDLDGFLFVYDPLAVPPGWIQNPGGP